MPRVQEKADCWVISPSSGSGVNPGQCISCVSAGAMPVGGKLFHPRMYRFSGKTGSSDQLFCIISLRQGLQQLTSDCQKFLLARVSTPEPVGLPVSLSVGSSHSSSRIPGLHWAFGVPSVPVPGLLLQFRLAGCVHKSRIGCSGPATTSVYCRLMSFLLLGDRDCDFSMHTLSFPFRWWLRPLTPGVYPAHSSCFAQEADLQHHSQWIDVPKTRIGGSGAGTPFVAVAVNNSGFLKPFQVFPLPFLSGFWLPDWSIFVGWLEYGSCLGCLAQSFFLHLLLVSFVVLLRTLLEACLPKRCPFLRLCCVPLHGPSSKALLAWSRVSCVRGHVEVSFRPLPRISRRTGRAGQCARANLRWYHRWSLTCLVFLSCPIQVWSAPKPWGEAVNIILESVRLLPEHLPGPQDTSPSQIPFWARPGFTPERLGVPDTVTADDVNPPLMEHPDIPVPPHNAELPANRERTFVQAYCYAMAPHHQAEVLPLQIGIPTSVGDFTTCVQRALNSLKLRFMPEVVPTVPQINPEFASVVVVPKWLHAAGQQVVVFDMRACGGPLYPDYVWDRVSFGECLAIARRHGIDQCTIYAQGHTQPLIQGASFLAVTGGVVQYQPTGEGSQWRSPLHARLDRTNDWSRDPDLPLEETEWPLFVSHHDQFTLYSADRFPGISAARAIADMVERCPRTVLFVTPPDQRLGDISVHGVSCRDAMAVFPLTPLPDREGALVFIDLRQVGMRVTHLYLDHPACAPAEIIDHFHLQAPIGFKVACWPRPDHTGRIPCVDGDILLFGFVPDSWDESDECEAASSESSSSLGSEISPDDDRAVHGEPDAASSNTPPRTVARGTAPPSRDASRSRSPRGSSSRALLDARVPITPSGLDSMWASKSRQNVIAHDTWTHTSTLEARYGSVLTDVSCPSRSPYWGEIAAASVFCADSSLLQDLLGLAVCRQVDPQEHKVSVEPHTGDGTMRVRIDELREITLNLGGPWPYLPERQIRIPGALQDFEEETVALVAELCWVRVLVLKWLFTSEQLHVAMDLPATPAEAVAAVEGARDRVYAQDFPHLLAAAPQPLEGVCVYLANPSWYGFDMIACVDLLRVDGRIFAFRMPEYADRQTVLQHVDLSPSSNVEVVAGFLDAPLLDGVPLHLFPGITLRFFPAGQPPGPASAISQVLQSTAARATEEVPAVSTPESCYCLVLRQGFQLFSPDDMTPMRYRDSFASAIGCQASQVAIYPALPRVADVAIQGHHCRTAIVVVPDAFVADSGNRFCFIVDARSMLQGFVCFKAQAHVVPVAQILGQLDEDAPLGLRAALESVPAEDVQLHVQPGQVLVARYVLAENADWDGDGPQHDNSDFDLLSLHSENPVTAEGGFAVHPTTEDGYRTLVPCMLFMNGYSPELYEVALAFPARMDDLIAQTLAARSATRNGIAPKPCTVRPQPDTSFFCLLMLPAWPIENCLILVDGRNMDGRIFALDVARIVDRRSLLAAASYDPRLPSLVYIRDSPWPMRDDAVSPLYTGDLVTICPSQHSILATGHLSEMMRSPELWDVAAVPSDPRQEFILLLCDTEPLLIETHPRMPASDDSNDSVDSIDQRAATALGLDESDFTLFAPDSDISDHWDRGRPVRQVYVVVRHPGMTEHRSSHCVVDARPALLGLHIRTANDRVIDLDIFADNLSEVCPTGFCVDIRGGDPGIALLPGLREVQTGTVLTVYFTEIDHQSRLAGSGPSSHCAEVEDNTSEGAVSRRCGASPFPLTIFAEANDLSPRVPQVPLGATHRTRRECRLRCGRAPLHTCLLFVSMVSHVEATSAFSHGIFCKYDPWTWSPVCPEGGEEIPSFSPAPGPIHFARWLAFVLGVLGQCIALFWLWRSAAGACPSCLQSSLARIGNRVSRTLGTCDNGCKEPTFATLSSQGSSDVTMTTQDSGRLSNTSHPGSNLQPDNGQDTVPAQRREGGDTPTDDHPRGRSDLDRSYGTRVSFVIFAFEYWPETVVVRLVLPARVREAFASLAQHREASAHRRSPKLVPVFPQPKEHVACVLALPHWDFEGVPVLVECRVGPERIFSTVLPHWVTREDFLYGLGIPADRPCFVFLRDIPWPLQHEAFLYPQVGDLVTVCEHHEDLRHRRELFQMLEPSQTWDLSYEFPGDDGDVNWILSTGTHTALPIAGDSFSLNSARTAAALDLEPGQFVLVPSEPVIPNHAHLGLRSQRVLAACSLADFSFADGDHRVPYILDQRPVLSQICLAYATEGLLDVAELCRRVSWRCPSRHHVRLLGGKQVAGSGNHLRRIETGAVITLEFHPDYLRDTFSEFHADTYTPDRGQPGGAARPFHTDGHSAQLAGDGGTGSTSQPSATEGGAAPSGSHRGQAPSAPPLWLQACISVLLSLPCRLLIAIAIASVEVVGMPVAPPSIIQGASFEEGPLGREAVLPANDRSSDKRSADVTEMPRPPARPVPTPCRGHFLQQEGLHTPPRVNDIEVGACRTLLEECVASRDCQAFWLAATLLETLEEHTKPRLTKCYNLREGEQRGNTHVIPVNLFEHLPPAISVDLSHVSMPLHQSIDQAVQWTVPGQWTLLRHLPGDLVLHPAARALVTQCEFEDVNMPHSLSIFTDGSHHEGVSSWAFVVLGAHADKLFLLGWAAGKVPQSCEDPLFLCPCDSHALSGEQTALLWSAVWALQGPVNCHIQVFSDCLVALNQAKGAFGWSSTDELAPLCRAAFQALSVARPAFDPSIRHVRSHQGCPANELADALAKHACRTQCDYGCAHQLWAAAAIRGGVLPWLWAQLEAIRAPDCWPQQVGSTFVDTHRHSASSPLTPNECYRVLGLQETALEEVDSPPAKISFRALSVNVQTLADSVETDGSAQPGQGFAGRARYLREQLTHLQVHVAALQEARSPDDATFVSDSHVRYCTARDPGGNFGCELWFSRLLPFVWKGQSIGHFHPNDFLTVSSSPRDLIIRFARSGVRILFVCIHAPVAGHKERESWWQALRFKLSKLCRGTEVIILGDFNTGFSTSLSQRIGDLVWPVKHPSPEGLWQILREHDLWLPSTFSGCHVGPHETWVSPTGSTGSRLDYIAVPRNWGVPPSGSWVDFSLDWGQARVDHYGICLDTSFLARVKHQPKQGAKNVDREAMATEEGRQLLSRICRNLPLLPWTCDVHRHYLAIEEHLSQALAVSFPSKRGSCRASHFSSTTWDLRQKRVWLRKQIAWERNGTRLAEALAAIQSWKAGICLSTGRLLALFRRMHSERRLRGLVHDLQAAKHLLRKSIRQDISSRIHETAAAAASLPCADVVTRLRPLLGPPKRRVRQRQALHSVCHPDGRPAQSATEVEDIWIEHFGNIEDGTKVDPVAFVRSIQETQDGRDLESYSLGVSDVPSRLELEQAFRQTQTGRAVGLDRIPGELLHFAADSASRALFQLFLKTALRSAEPIQFKGGALHAVWKGKSNPAFCSAHRGILVSSNIGKAFHKITRTRAVPALKEITTDMQIGGLPSFPVVLASHFVRLYQTGARLRRNSHGLLFLDLREAFYRVVRPLLTGTACHDERVAAAVKAVKLPPGVMHELYEHLQSVSAAKEAGATDWADMAINEALTGTWFRFQGGRQVVSTAVGSRPGDNLADICFSFIFAKVLRAVQQDLCNQGLVPRIPWSSEMVNQIHQVETSEGETVPVLDATWMDDATFLVGSPSAASLPQALVATGASVVDACVGRALLPNLDKGKTEFVASPLGAGSRLVRQQLFADADPCLRLQSRLWPEASVRLRPFYQHLGGVIHHESSLSRELKRRAALAWKACNSRKRLVFGSPRVACKDKVVLFESLVLSVLLYGAGTWDQLSGKDEAILTNAYHGMCFHMLRPRYSYEEALHLGGARTIALLELPTLQTLLHVARLRHLLSCVRTAVPVLWAMLHWQGVWLQSARLSLQWLWDHVDGGSLHKTWQSAWHQWQELCVRHPQKWKGLVRKAQCQGVLREVWESAEAQHLGLLVKQLRLAGASVPARPSPSGPTRHCCAPCQRTFPSYQAWSVHAFKCHGLVGEYRRVLSGLQCQACLRHFTTHVKLCRHLQYFPVCRHALQARGFSCTPEPGIGSRKSVDAGNLQAPSLQAQGPLLPPSNTEWEGYLDRPSAEVAECLGHLLHDLQPAEVTLDTIWQRAQIAFSSVCLPNRKIVATARAWSEALSHDPGKDRASTLLLQVARRTSEEDPVDWLVVSPSNAEAPICTFRDARQLLGDIDVSQICLGSCTQPLAPTFIRVGPSVWLARNPHTTNSEIDFSHQECLDSLSSGAAPSFFEDLSDGVVFVLSTIGLPTWANRPQPPVKRKPLFAQLSQASFASDLIRFALRLWIKGVPAALLCPAGLDFAPRLFSALPGVVSSRLGDQIVWRTSDFDWEPVCFTFSN